MHQNRKYQVHLVTSARSLSRQKSENERRCSIDVMKVEQQEDIDFNYHLVCHAYTGIMGIKKAITTN